MNNFAKEGVKVLKFIIIGVIVLFIIGIFSGGEDDHNEANARYSSYEPEQSSTPPPNYRYWNNIERDGDELRCDWCAHKRNEEETGRIICSLYPGYVEEDSVCDDFLSRPKYLADRLAI